MKSFLRILICVVVLDFGLAQELVPVDSIRLETDGQITDFGTDDFNNIYFIKNSTELNKIDWNTRQTITFSNQSILEDLNTQNILEITVKSGFFNLIVLDNQLNQIQDKINFPIESGFSPTLTALVDNSVLWGYDPVLQRLIMWDYRHKKILRQSVILSEKTADEFYADLIYHYNKIYLIGYNEILRFDEFANLEASIPFQEYTQLQLSDNSIYFLNINGLHQLNLLSKQISNIHLPINFDNFSINGQYLFGLKDKVVYIYASQK